MAIVDRSFTYRGQIKLTSRDLSLTLAGKKTCTIRLGRLGVEGDRISLTDGRRRVQVQILEVDSGRPYEGITDAEAVADGLASRLDLDNDMRRFYRWIDPEQPMTLIWFALQDVHLQASLEEANPDTESLK